MQPNQDCEHTVPQSFFNKQDLMVSDTHHLRTAWSKANNGRQNYPFKRLNGTSGTFFGPNFTQTTKQPPQIENWSVLDKGKFMPRQVQLGDTARAIAYFYTRYPTEAGSITKVINVDEIIEWDQPICNTNNTQELLKCRKTETHIMKKKDWSQERTAISPRSFCARSTSDFTILLIYSFKIQLSFYLSTIIIQVVKQMLIVHEFQNQITIIQLKYVYSVYIFSPPCFFQFMKYCRDFILHYLECRPPPLFTYRPPADFPKNIKGSISESTSGCLWLIFYFRFGFPFQLQTPFLKIFFKYQLILNFCYFNEYNNQNSMIYDRLLSFLVCISLKIRQNQQYLINQISNHFSYRPKIQFSYRPFYSQILKGFVTERFWGLQVNMGGGLHSRQCSINQSGKQLIAVYRVVMQENKLFSHFTNVRLDQFKNILQQAKNKTVQITKIQYSYILYAKGLCIFIFKTCQINDIISIQFQKCQNLYVNNYLRAFNMLLNIKTLRCHYKSEFKVKIDAI
ncbi:Endonuclease_I [Hexamita inflata]|uniref:Endonuclease_I n=1 Tax=Hexamita inflata TaxID=28002 RepID=A0ABP1L4U7_9EUKA